MTADTDRIMDELCQGVRDSCLTITLIEWDRIYTNCYMNRQEQACAALTALRDRLTQRFEEMQK